MSAEHRDEDDEVIAAATASDADRVEANDEGHEEADDEGDADQEGAEEGAAQETTAGEPPEISRKVRRRRRRTRPRSKTIAMKRLTREELRVGAIMYPPVDVPRPSTREQCREDVRPCPWVACKHHLYLDINPETGSIKINFPDLEPWELRHTCALDVAERGGITLEEVGEIMNLTRERIRQVEVRGLLKLKMGSPSADELGADLLKEQGN
jgi:Sigma-70, region 4